MYQQINLSDRSMVGNPAPLPPNLVGLSVTDLADLSAAISPAPPGLAGQGFWPVVPATPAYDPDTQVLDGTSTISTPDPVSKTVPSTANVRALTVAELAAALSAAQAAKVADLMAACATQILGGYTSSALGALYTYPSKSADQSNMTVSVVASLLPSLPADWTTVFWCADQSGTWAMRPHTAAQIQQAGQDGKASILAAQTKLANLNLQVATTTATSQLAAITW